MNREQLLNKLSGHKNLIFLIMCLGVHVLNLIIFLILQLFPLMIVNLLSSIFYLCMLALYEKEDDKEIILIYLEIIVFSLVSDLITGGIFNYNYFTIGMVSVIYFLLTEKTKHKHLIQTIGCVVIFVDYFCQQNNVCLSEEVAIAGITYRSQLGAFNLIITIFTLIYVSGLYLIELSTNREKLKYASNHDLLTGLYNRRFLENTITRSHKENTSEYCIAMFDIDNFKHVNDTYGHDAGDRVLETVSKCISENIEKDYLPIRWGGEEFIIYMPQTNLEAARKIIEKICDVIRSQEVETKKCDLIKVTVTVGIKNGTDLNDYENVIRQADDYLYKGKNSGKNCIVTE